MIYALAQHQHALFVASYLLLWSVVLLFGFLLLGLVRSSAVLAWRLEQFETTTPRQVGRSGLSLGAKAPDFTLKDTTGTAVSLSHFAGKKVLLVFTQPGCAPCNQIVPELNALLRRLEVEVVVVSNGDECSCLTWAQEHGAAFPVLCQEHWSLSRRFEVFATPFAFLLDEGGLIIAKGIINSRQHIRFLLSSVRRAEERHAAVPSPAHHAHL